MYRFVRMSLGVTILACLGLAPWAQAETSLDELQKTLEKQQQQIERLQKQDREMQRQLETTADYAEKAASGTHGGGQGKTTIGGYGELHYNRLKNKTDRSEKREIDFHRFVLFFGHEFSPRIRLFSELELEHSLVEDTADGSGSGEVELEQAYVEFDLNDSLSAKGGLFLVPVGILNETHEPPTFYGVERNPVEKNIIPTTWWEGGGALAGRLGKGLSYDLAYHSGLKVTTGDYRIRGGRQKVAKASAENWAGTGRLKWSAVPGVELAVSGQVQQDITQNTDSESIGATLVEAHAVVNKGPFGLRALYAQWDLDGDGPEAIGRDKQSGYYVEPSIKFGSKLGLFARYNVWDNEAGNSADTEYEQIDVGINYWPHENVVVKLDYQDQDAPDTKDEFDGINIGIGYMF